MSTLISHALSHGNVVELPLVVPPTDKIVKVACWVVGDGYVFPDVGARQEGVVTATWVVIKHTLLCILLSHDC